MFSTNIGRYFGKALRPADQWKQRLGLSNFTFIYHKLVRMDCTYLSCKKTRLRSNNSFAQTVDGNYIQIDSFVVDTLNEQEYTLCKTVNIANIRNVEEHLLNFQIKRLVSIDEELRAIDSVSVDKICVHMTCGNESFLCAIPNKYSY